MGLWKKLSALSLLPNDDRLFVAVHAVQVACTGDKISLLFAKQGERNLSEKIYKLQGNGLLLQYYKECRLTPLLFRNKIQKCRP